VEWVWGKSGKGGVEKFPLFPLSRLLSLVVHRINSEELVVSAVLAEALTTN
jgi:hypothetical protein